jgi:8-oxo-dGTP pyrophosphatase MutT (NUDIX family)
MRFEEVETRLRLGLAAPLPGLEAQIRLAPRPRHGPRPGVSPGPSRAAAGLMLLFPAGDATDIVLTVRASHLPSHAGQVSLPGGAVEPGETFDQAALREAREEVGLDPSAVRLVGRLTPLHIPVSGFVLHPVVALMDWRPVLRPSDREVERILEVPLHELADPARRLSRRVNLDDRGEVDIPYIEVRGAELWGATAMVLSELFCVLEPPAIPRSPGP